MPGPRNYRPASVRMAVSNMHDIMMRKGAMELGAICFRITRQSNATMALADNTQSLSRTEIVEARMTRRPPGSMVAATATTRIYVDCSPKAATMARARIRSGSAIHKSFLRCTVESRC